MSGLNPLQLTGLAINVVASGVLIAALLAPFFDVKKSKKTYAMSDEFFLYFCFGAIFMWLNALISISLVAIKANIQLVDCLDLAFFASLLAVNCFSAYINIYIYRTKKRNMKLAQEKGISEKEYWELYLRPGVTAE